MSIHCSIAICTPIPAEESMGVRRLGRLTPEWQRARNGLLPPMGHNLTELYADGMEVGVARTQAVQRALQAGIKYLFFLDWDTLPPQDALCRLVYHLDNHPEHDIAAGMYCSKTMPPWPLLWREWEQGVSWDWTLGELLTDRVVGVPMGCTLLRLSLFGRLPPFDPDNPWFETGNGTLMDEWTEVPYHSTEDLSFCLRFKNELQDKILVDTGIQCSHIDPSTGIQYRLPDNCLPVRRARELVLSSKSVLHVGCGPKTAGSLPDTFDPEEWREVRLDINKSVKPDIVGSMTDMRQVMDGSHDAVYSNHNVEHLYAHEVGIAFREFLRVLKPGGTLYVNVPDIQAVAKEIAAGNVDDPLYISPAGPISPLDIIYGYRQFTATGNSYQQHKIGFTDVSLEKQLLEAGFESVSVTHENWSLQAKAVKPKA